MNAAKQAIFAEMKALKEKMADLQSKIVSKTFADKITVKIGEKGTLNVYGLGRFPICLYATQAIRLEKLLSSPEFKQFVVDNTESLAKKAE